MVKVMLKEKTRMIHIQSLALKLNKIAHLSTSIKKSDRNTAKSGILLL